MSIPSTGVINAARANPTNSTPLGTVATVAAVMYNYYDPTLATENVGGLLTSSGNRIILNPYGTHLDVSYQTIYNTFDGPGQNGDPNSPYPFPGGSGQSTGLVSLTCLTLEEFLNLFYATNAGYFNVNPTNIGNAAVNLSAQTYTSANTPGSTAGPGSRSTNSFSLYQELLKAYCYSKSINVNDLDPRIMLLLQKETFAVQSLANVKGTTIALGWDELVGSLQYSGLISIADATHGANVAIVPFSVILNYHSFVLDIDLSIQFTYNVAMGGYVNNPTPALGITAPYNVNF